MININQIFNRQKAQTVRENINSNFDNLVQDANAKDAEIAQLSTMILDLNTELTNLEALVNKQPLIPNWVTASAYKTGSIVAYNSKYYVAKVDISSGSAFNAPDWKELLTA